MNAQLKFEPLKTQPMPTRERLNRIAEGLQGWIDGKVADHNARRAADRRVNYSVQGWSIVNG